MRNLLIPTIFLLVGCGDETENSVQIESEKAPVPVFSIATDDPAINQLLPTIRKMCPGLDKYADQFTDITVYENSYPSRTTIKFHIDENAKLPNDYMANGNNCFLDIEDNETVLSISKSACQSVCLDQQNVPSGTLKLKL
ncbi:hypothetical protein [Photorhabdus thracensis]|uniref:hypothetical protein n=1 Tax=Photorhabdus thracensis TaxID=230089 RepID=UPI001E35712C|nr:hypothetical protein [Photorhabdus thracensis]MCC8420907.1 hypothetical protein [Photorhabdus thracensis]